MKCDFATYKHKIDIIKVDIKYIPYYIPGFMTGRLF